MPEPSDTYRTLAAPGHAEIKVKGSRFIAEAHPAPSETAAEATIARVRKRDYDATHVCTAYRVGIEGDGAGEEVFRYNDDGEPGGTAGPPILRQIDGRTLTNTLVTVTRYYGGTKLGTGGLIRTYGDAAALALDAAPVAERILRTTFRLRFAYDDTSPAMHTVSRFEASITGTDYGVDTRLEVAVRRSLADDFAAAFVEALGGRGEVARLDGGPEHP